MDAKEILAEARRMIEGPGRWTQGSYWRDRDGPSYCLRGAVMVAGAASRESGEMDRALSILHSAAGCESIIRWNDAPGRTQAEVLDLIDAASLRLWNYVPPEPMPSRTRRWSMA